MKNYINDCIDFYDNKADLSYKRFIWGLYFSICIFLLIESLTIFSIFMKLNELCK